MKKIKKFIFDKKYIKISIYVLLVIIASILSWRAITGFGAISGAVSVFFHSAAGLLAPFVYGFFIAYFFNAPVRWFEKTLYGRFKRFGNKPRAKRVLSILSAYLVFIGFVAWLVAFAVPDIVSSLKGLASTSRNAFESINSGVWTDLENNRFFSSLLSFVNQTFSTSLTFKDVFDKILEPFQGILNSMPSILQTIYDVIISAASKVFNFIIGMIIAFYMLTEKENIRGFLSKLLFVAFRKERVDKFFSFAKNGNSVIERFIVGKIIDSAIIGAMFFVIFCLPLGLPFPMLLTLIVGVTNILPYFGPIVGGVLITLIVFIEDPVKGLETGIAILVLQQFDGNVLGPKILGDSTGVKPMSVIFSILVGGALFGVPGMFFGVPVFAVISSAFKTYINRRHEEKYPVPPAPAENGPEEGMLP